MKTRRAFTLIELLTVMAISVVLLSLLSIPLVQGFNFTKAAQGYAAAQEKARLLIDQVGREIGNGAAVRDNYGDKGATWLQVPGKNGQYEFVKALNTKLDILMPDGGEPIYKVDPVTGDQQLFNPDINKLDPTLRTPKGQISLPTTTGFRMVRYFIGLKHPFRFNNKGDLLDVNGNVVTGGGQAAPAFYNNPFDSILAKANGLENLYVLYRADIDYRRWNSATSSWEFNKELFTDIDGDGVPDDLDDPDFFRAFGPADISKGNTDFFGRPITAAIAQAKQARILAWLRHSRVVVDDSRQDMIQPVYNRQNFTAIYDGNVPRIVPLVQFKPMRVDREPVTGSMAVRTNAETTAGEKTGSETYFTKYGYWTNAVVRLWPSVPNPNDTQNADPNWVNGTPYLVARARIDAAKYKLGTSLFDYINGDDTSDGTETFDISTYNFDRSNHITTGIEYPFSDAIKQANARSGWLSDVNLRNRFIPIAVDARRGEVRSSFGIDEIGGTGSGTHSANTDNRPVALTGTLLRPDADATSKTADWRTANYSPSSPTGQINDRFNLMWNQWNTIFGNLGLAKEQACRRFVDLRQVPCADGSITPLNVDPTKGFSRTRIVPGSEIVIGPDQNEGPNKGRPIRYTRVTKPGTAGKNQYYINYETQNPPDFKRVFGIDVNTNPSFYDDKDPISALLMPQFRMGYLEFDSDPAIPLGDNTNPGAIGNISVFYRFQMTGGSDVLAVDYDSRQVVDVALTLRSYSYTTTTGPNAQQVTLATSAAVRNATR